MSAVPRSRTFPFACISHHATVPACKPDCYESGPAPRSTHSSALRCSFLAVSPFPSLPRLPWFRFSSSFLLTIAIIYQLVPLFRVAYSFTMLQLEAPGESENLLTLFPDLSFTWSSQSLSRESSDDSAHTHRMLHFLALYYSQWTFILFWIYYKTNLKGRFCFYPFIYSRGHSGTKPLRNLSKIAQLESGMFGIWTQMAWFQTTKDLGPLTHFQKRAGAQKHIRPSFFFFGPHFHRVNLVFVL